MRSWCAGGIGEGLLADAEVLVSELVTNALVHGGGRIVLRACLDEDRLLVEVIDQHSQFKRELGRRVSSRQADGGWASSSTSPAVGAQTRR
jgi:anti-sigma regulatory factor (Ser/Thr protein kinase)